MEIWLSNKTELPTNLFETKEHIIEWIEKLKQQISEIKIEEDNDFPNYEQEMEACYKLAMYLRKLQLHEYTIIEEVENNV